ncbi:MAG: response regulator [Leptolyngbyaceae cyanobacterium]
MRDAEQQNTFENRPILLVDDDPINLGLLSDALCSLGCKVLVGVDGEGAIAQALHNPPMLILLDVQMSGIDGFETCRRLKADPRTRSIPIIFMTASDEVSDKVKAFKMGAVDYVTKPFRTAEVIARVQTHLELYQLRQKLQQQNQQLEQEVCDRLQAEAVLSKINQDLEAEIRKRTAEVYTNAERLRLVIEATQDGVWDWDIASNTIFRSPQLLAFFGLSSSSELAYEQFYTRIHPDDRSKFTQAMQQHLEKNTPYKIEIRIQQVDGEYGWYLDQGHAIRDQDGQPTRVVGALSDISDRKKAELELATLNRELEDRVSKRTAQLEAVNQELESFSYSVSHDLRAPLRHIHGFINALRRSLQKSYGSLDEKVEHYITVVDESSTRMGQLIDGLLLLSRVGRRSLQSQRIDLNTTVQRAIEIVLDSSEILTNPDTTIQWNIDRLPITYGDRTLVQQVFINLISNAIKFSQKTQAPEINIGIVKENVIFIKDNGAGFSMDYADKLFSPFERLHSRREFQGTGIGLSIVQRIIHRHEGQIWADSAPNQGATFFFTLPSIEADQREANS